MKRLTVQIALVPLTNKMMTVLSQSQLQVASCEGTVVCPVVASDIHALIGGGT